MNPQVDTYLVNGCMRCKFGGTPKCKVNRWREALILLRQLVLESGLKEEIKWGAPVYTHHGKNVVLVNALKESANIGFFKGALLRDTEKLLQQQGNIQSSRIIKFHHVDEILKVADILKSYIQEAIHIEESGQKVPTRNQIDSFPDELIQVFDAEPAFKEAFEALTPGRQRGYIHFFSQAKQAATRAVRIEKYKAQIFMGRGLNDY